MDNSRATWTRGKRVFIRSSRCKDLSCVEVELSPRIAVRDSKNPDIGPVHFSDGEWQNLLDWVNSARGYNGIFELNWDMVFNPLRFHSDEIREFCWAVRNKEFEVPARGN